MYVCGGGLEEKRGGLQLAVQPVELVPIGNWSV